MSLNGFAAVSEQDADNPLGVGGMHRTQPPEPRLLIDQFLLGLHAQHLRSERCCLPAPLERATQQLNARPGQSRQRHNRSPTVTEDQSSPNSNLEERLVGGTNRGLVRPQSCAAEGANQMFVRDPSTTMTRWPSVLRSVVPHVQHLEARACEGPRPLLSRTRRGPRPGVPARTGPLLNAFRFPLEPHAV